LPRLPPEQTDFDRHHDRLSVIKRWRDTLDKAEVAGDAIANEDVVLKSV
jgi:hypothetical protein